MLSSDYNSTTMKRRPEQRYQVAAVFCVVVSFVLVSSLYRINRTETFHSLTLASIDQTIEGDVIDALKNIQHTITRMSTLQRPEYAGSETSPFPLPQSLDNMDDRDLSGIFHWYVANTQVFCNRLYRMGPRGDDEWDICEDPRFINDPWVNHTQCLIYSYGIQNDSRFDVAKEGRYGCEVHVFSPRITVTKERLGGEEVQFHQAGIAGANSITRKLYTLGTQRQILGHEPLERRLNIVKMDVDGAELTALPEAIKEGSLRDVGQLLFDIHIKANSRYTMDRYLAIFRDLWNDGFRLYLTVRKTSKDDLYRDKYGIQQSKRYKLSMVNMNYKNY